MPPSMRRQTCILLLAATGHERSVIAKKHAVKLLTAGKTQRVIASMTGLSKGSVYMLNKTLMEKKVGTAGVAVYS